LGINTTNWLCSFNNYPTNVDTIRFAGWAAYFAGWDAYAGIYPNTPGTINAIGASD